MKRIKIIRKSDNKKTHGVDVIDDQKALLWVEKHNTQDIIEYNDQGEEISRKPSSPWGLYGSYNIVIEDITDELTEKEDVIKKEKSVRKKRINKIVSSLENFSSLSDTQKLNIVKDLIIHLLVKENKISEDISGE